ncbi:hypothetical protein M885DRAFT_615355 [Pelagophyceae sp. CCMP2097]|nr:hypothetical protein M885DRAFT_615355 [Pelagophyceae sp. CCMP2097]|mmetsp:Transcript_33209/g.114250  ORF Transcript_33209/g.114250 Transcript_33209/m.114250 type:complete len:383 (-) Transcript_33209:28-1176(-)
MEPVSAATFSTGQRPDRSGARALAEAQETGRAALTHLSAQGESLEHSEMVVDSNQYTIDKAARVVSAMTWYGWVKNAFTDLPKPPEPRPRRYGDGLASYEPTGGASDWARANDGVVSRDDRAQLFAGAAAPARRRRSAAEAEQDAYVDALSAGLDDVLRVGSAIGEEVREQNAAAPHLKSKLEQLWESTRAVTRAAGHVSETGVTAVPRRVATVALRCARTKRFVRARGADVALSEEVDVLRATSLFAVFERRAHLLGLKAVVADKWLGLGMTGAVRCGSRSFGTNEEWDFDLAAARRGDTAQLLCCAANWGAGCYIRVNADGRLIPAAPVCSKGADDAKRPAARFEVIFIDENFVMPTYAEQLVVRKPLAHAGEAGSAQPW